MTAHLAECKLIPAAARKPGNCGWCGKRLPRTKTGRIHKSRRWCGTQCRMAYLVNHVWAYARKEAAKRDGFRCRQCSKSPYDNSMPVYANYRSLKAYHAAIARYRAKVKAMRLEIHHVKPVSGKGYKPSCLHHQGNLRTVCHSCHREIHG